MSFNSIRVNDTDTNYTHSIFDISDYNSGTSYADLSSALAAVPEDKHHGGMTIRYMLDSKTGESVYMQYRLISSTWSDDIRYWFSEEESIKIVEKKISNISNTISTSEDEEIEITTDDDKTITTITALKGIYDNDVVEFYSDNGIIYAKIGVVGDKIGIFSKNIYNLNGEPIQAFEIDTEHEVMIIGDKKYKLIPYVE